MLVEYQIHFLETVFVHVAQFIGDSWFFLVIRINVLLRISMWGFWKWCRIKLWAKKRCLTIILLILFGDTIWLCIYYDLFRCIIIFGSSIPRWKIFIFHDNRESWLSSNHSLLSCGNCFDIALSSFIIIIQILLTSESSMFYLYVNYWSAYSMCCGKCTSRLLIVDAHQVPD